LKKNIFKKFSNGYFFKKISKEKKFFKKNLKIFLFLKKIFFRDIF